MKHFALVFATICCIASTNAQNLYFPPITGNVWDTVSPTSLGWCVDSIPPLLALLDSNNTKGFIVLKDGKIVIEHYFDTFTLDSLWYWASAGKTVTSYLTGIAQQEGFISIDESSSMYLGAGWTSLTPAQEAAITVRNQLTMTTGLDDSGPDIDCTDPVCLNYLAAPGTRWSYHNAPYTLLDGVISGSTGTGLNQYLASKLNQTIGLGGFYLPIGYNNVLFSKARGMARFGLLMLNQGNWNGTQLMTDQNYFQEMTTTSQSFNESYGYLWWLNSGSTFMLPSSQFVFIGKPTPSAPADMFSALGKNDQYLNVVPSKGLIVIRMGNAAGTGTVPVVLLEQIWQKLNTILCSPMNIEEVSDPNVKLFPDPVSDQIQLWVNGKPFNEAAQVIDMHGRSFELYFDKGQANLGHLPPGIYVIRWQESDSSFFKKLIIAR